ncbi:MAG TPA: ECF-type sigma factor [Gemmatimonadaceae bacterium]|nr:ECF-type sigma factor [Gemmatimonadaceae bacterium]
MHDATDVTGLLSAANAGDSEALGDVVALLYEQLRRIARHRLAHEHDGHTLESAALVNEAYLRLLGLERVRWRDRGHLLSMAARMMRRILIDHANRRRTLKRGGGEAPVTLDGALAALEQRADELHALDEALQQLERLSARQSRVVECRFFAGLSIEETAEALALSPATVKRDWLAARAWLNRELAG